MTTLPDTAAIAAASAGFILFFRKDLLVQAFDRQHASAIGLPVSTTHTLVGAVLGIGIARGIGALNLGVIGSIFMSWLITLPVGAGLSIVFFLTLRGIFL